MKRSLVHGVSIVEVIVALIILSLAIPMVIGFSTTSKKVQVAANELENATAAAQAVIDSLALTPAFMVEQGTPKSKAVQGPIRMYDASWTYTPVGRHAGIVRVTIAWKQGNTPHAIVVAGEVP